MILENIRQQIKTILAGVQGIGVIHDYDRWAVDMGKLMSLFKDGEGRINTIMFRRKTMEKRKTVMGNAALDRAHVWFYRCFMGLKDDQATGLLFDALLGRIEEAFDGHDTLNGTCITISPSWGPMAGVSGMQIDLVDEYMIGGVLCHYAELRMCTIERNLR